MRTTHRSMATAGVVAAAVLFANAVSAQTAEVLEDGSVAISDIEQPGRDAAIPEDCAGETDHTALVLAAIREWVGDTASVTSEAIMSQYAEDLDETYIAFSGNASLTNHADYVRIDGPGVWIEFVCQNGVV